MIFSFLPTLAVGLALLAGPVVPNNSTAKPATTHRLEVHSLHSDCLQIDGAATESILLDLVNPHIGTATRDGAAFTTISLPDGSLHFKGAFRLYVQTRDGGTIKIDVCDGEAVVSPRAVADLSNRQSDDQPAPRA